MAIHINEQKKQFNIQTKDSTYQILVDPYGILIHPYYGRRIEDEDLSDLIVRNDVGFSGNLYEAGNYRNYSLENLPQEVPSSGVGDFREDMIRISHEDGSTAASFRYVGYEVQEGAYTLPDMPALYGTEKEPGETLVLILKEIASECYLKLYYGVFEEENIITRAVRVENRGRSVITLDKILSCNVDFIYGDYEMITFSGRHAMERGVERVPVKRAKVEIGSIRGTSSHQYNPSMILCEPDTTEEHGCCYGFCFVYSGNFVANAQKDQMGGTRVQMGIHPAQFQFRLAEGESFTAPQVILSYSDEGFTKLSSQYHHILREHMCRGTYQYRKRPVLINNWEATYFNFDRDKLIHIARTAAGLGIEMLVLDDGWFGKRDDDNSGLGDWFVNEKKLGGSLKELSDEIHGMGMKFGLWLEPEMISEDSDLYRAHSDWALQIPGRQPMRGRNQLVLDLSRAEVREYVLNQIFTVLDSIQIDYIKWDMNRSICDIYSHGMTAGRMGELYHRHVLAVYEMQEKLLERYPHILLENCSGGGGRFDAAMLYYSPQIWCSDNTDAISRLQIQYGTSFFYPIGTMGAHVSACPNHQTGRTVPFQTRADVALAGSFGYELDLGKISEKEQAMVREQVAQFHEYYELTHHGEYYRLTAPGERVCMAWEFVAQDKSRALLTVVKTDSDGNSMPIHLPVRGLDEKKQYICSMNGVTRCGKSWNHAGVTIDHALCEYESIRIEFHEI